ncbi:MAG: endonuclease III [Anaeromyxobacteraceae bacterium]
MVARKPPRPTAERRARAAEIVDRLERAMPDVKIALDYGSDVELLVAVILSAQSTDAGVNKATPALFAAFPDADAFARATPEELWPYVQRVGLYRNKSKAIVAAMKVIAGEHGGRVPRTRAALEALPGVGRKTAGVVLVHLGAANAFPVDTHVGRVARRLGLSREENPDKVERDLCALLPEERWSKGHLLFVWHGRRVCKALAPACSRCPVEPLCPKRGVSAAIRR